MLDQSIRSVKIRYTLYLILFVVSLQHHQQRNQRLKLELIVISMFLYVGEDGQEHKSVISSYRFNLFSSVKEGAVRLIE